MGNSLIRTRFSSSRLHSISGTTQGIDMVPNNFQIELKGLPIATSQFTGVKHVTHRETGWENSGSKETGLEYDGFIVYVHFLNLGNLELEISLNSPEKNNNSENPLMWVKQCHSHRPPVITIFIGGIETIPRHGWFIMALFYHHYMVSHPPKRMKQPFQGSYFHHYARQRWAKPTL